MFSLSFQKYLIFDPEVAIHTVDISDINRPLRMEPIQCFGGPHS